MHMPTRRGVLVLTAVAACLAAYYALVVRSPDTGDWRVYRGTGRLLGPAEGRPGAIEVGYTVEDPTAPLCGFRRLARVTADGPAPMVLEYQSERPTTLLVVVCERGGAGYEARLVLEQADAWKPISLGPERFEPCSRPPGADVSRSVDFSKLTGRVDFHDGSGVEAPPSAPFSNRLRLTPPAFAVSVQAPRGGGP
jgi:hypothetical protein